MTTIAPGAVTHVSPFGDYAGRIVFSGAENHLFQLMVGQRAAGLDVELLMLVVHDGPRLVAQAQALQRAGIRVTRLVYDRSLAPAVGRAAWVAQLPRLVALMRARRHRIIHTHQPHASQLGRFAAWTGGARRIIDSVHNDEPFFARPSWRVRLKALQRITKATIAISANVKAHLVDHVGLDPSRIEVIPYGIEPPLMVDREAARRDLGVPLEAFVVGFVGRLVPQKDLGTLIDAMTGLPDAHLCLVGAGDEEAALRAHCARVGLRNVHFAGARPNGADLMAAFDVFALSSRWEGLGLVLLEAMSRGVPIVATRGGAIPEVLAQGELGLLSDVSDADGMRRNIVRLRSDADLQARLVRNGHCAIEQRYSVAAMVSATTAVYESICASE
ncbi:MAG: glycosyltransferase family 4 protein [Hyphomicrobiaceae bacterium]|nr:glycosyltransferase family 4 protein [Hyphomicrobiaceae bacterium]